MQVRVMLDFGKFLLKLEHYLSKYLFNFKIVISKVPTPIRIGAWLDIFQFNETYYKWS